MVFMNSFEFLEFNKNLFQKSLFELFKFKRDKLGMVKKQFLLETKEYHLKIEKVNYKLLYADTTAGLNFFSATEDGASDLPFSFFFSDPSNLEGICLVDEVFYNIPTSFQKILALEKDVWSSYMNNKKFLKTSFIDQGINKVNALQYVELLLNIFGLFSEDKYKFAANLNKDLIKIFDDNKLHLHVYKDKDKKKEELCVQFICALFLNTMRSIINVEKKILTFDPILLAILGPHIVNLSLPSHEGRFEPSYIVFLQKNVGILLKQIFVGFATNKINQDFYCKETMDILRNSFYNYYYNNPSFPFFLQCKYATDFLYFLIYTIEDEGNNFLLKDFNWSLFSCLLAFSYSILLKNMEFVRLFSKIFLAVSPYNPYKIEEVKRHLYTYYKIFNRTPGKSPTGYVMTLKGFMRARQLMNVDHKDPKTKIITCSDSTLINFQNSKDEKEMRNFLYIASGDSNFLTLTHKICYGDIIRFFPYFICINIEGYSEIADRFRAFHKSINGFTFPLPIKDRNVSYNDNGSRYLDNVSRFYNSFYNNEIKSKLEHNEDKLELEHNEDKLELEHNEDKLQHKFAAFLANNKDPLFDKCYTSSSFDFSFIDQQEFHEVLNLMFKYSESLSLHLNKFPQNLSLLHFSDEEAKFKFITDYSEGLKEQQFFFQENEEDAKSIKAPFWE
jgi:hypothetical protein